MSVTTVKMVKVSDRTYEALTDMGRKNETYDEIIWKLVQEYHNNNKRARRKPE